MNFKFWIYEFRSTPSVGGLTYLIKFSGYEPYFTKVLTLYFFWCKGPMVHGHQWSVSYPEISGPVGNGVLFQAGLNCIRGMLFFRSRFGPRVCGQSACRVVSRDCDCLHRTVRWWSIHRAAERHLMTHNSPTYRRPQQRDAHMCGLSRGSS